MRVLVLNTAAATAALLARLLAVGEVRRLEVGLPEQLIFPGSYFEALSRPGWTIRLDLAPPAVRPVRAGARTEEGRT